jgi:heme oxygenase (mycobilin-producing)
MISGRKGKADALRAFLGQVIPTVASSRGCLSCKLLQSQDNPARLVILEVWESVESHKAAVKNIPPEMLATIMELLDGRPSGEYFRE